MDIAHRPTADPLLRLVAYAFATAYDRPPATVWRAPYAFHLTAPPPRPAPVRRPGPAGSRRPTGCRRGLAPREDGMLRWLAPHPRGDRRTPPHRPARPTPAWAARPYAALRTLAPAGFGRGGTDLHLHSTLPNAVGLSVAEPLECAAALAVADRALRRGGRRPTRAQAAVCGRRLPGDEALRRAVLFARPGRTARG